MTRRNPLDHFQKVELPDSEYRFVRRGLYEWSNRKGEELCRRRNLRFIEALGADRGGSK